MPALPDGMRKTFGGLLIVLSIAIALAWAGSIFEVLARDTPVPEYEEHPTLFWLVRLMDLGLVIPVAIVIGVGLLRRALWAMRPGYALAAFLPLLVGAVAGMAIVMQVRDDPAASPAFLGMTVVLTLALALVCGWLLCSLSKAPRRL